MRKFMTSRVLLTIASAATMMQWGCGEGGWPFILVGSGIGIVSAALGFFINPI